MTTMTNKTHVPNPARGEYAINLDRPRVIKYDLNSFIAFECETGQTLESFATRLMEGELKISDIRSFVWAGLVHEDVTLTLADAGGLIDYGHGDSYSEKLQWLMKEFSEAFRLCWPDQTGDSAKKKMEEDGQ